MDIISSITSRSSRCTNPDIMTWMSGFVSSINLTTFFIFFFVGLSFVTSLVPELIILASAISFIIFWVFSMFYQIFLSPQVKRWAIISYKHDIYELSHELPNDLRHVRKLGSIRKVSIPHEWNPSAQSPRQNESPANTSRKLMKNRNSKTTFLVVHHFTPKPELVPNIPRFIEMRSPTPPAAHPGCGPTLTLWSFEIPLSVKPFIIESLMLKIFFLSLNNLFWLL